MAAQNSAGIQTLLEAEREAQRIVQIARAYRTQKVKKARIEAQEEIEEYKKQKEAEFKRFEAEHSGSNAQLEKEADRQVQEKLEEIKKIGEEKIDKIAEELVKAVIDIHPKPHRNAAKAG